MGTKNALFSVSSLGLGHATRSLVVIKSYAQTHALHIISAGNALAFLKSEIPTATFYEYQDYPPLERGTGWKFYVYMVFDSLVTTLRIRSEHTFVQSLVKKIEPEFIISDGRYGSYDSVIPSFLISHQISFVMPPGFGFFQGFADYFNKKTFQKFTAVIIPDFKDEQFSLAGKLSHHGMLQDITHEYVGILSSYTKTKSKKDIDVLFVVSGYLSEHRPAFIASLFDQAKTLPGKKVFMLGDPHAKPYEFDAKNNIEMYGMAAGDVRVDLFTRAHTVVSRSGYTTIMDLAELGISGVLTATPGQTEQEYLTKYLSHKGLLRTSLSDNTTLSYTAPWNTAYSLEKVRALVTQYTHETNRASS